MSGGLRIADAARVETLLDTLAGRIRAELEPCDLTLVGLLRRGAPLARRIGRRLGESVPVGVLRLERYADDLTVVHETPRLDEESLDVDVAGRTVVIVDDVLYSGRTLLRAAVHLNERGARRVLAAVLCSRGGQDLPVAAVLVGMHLELGPELIVDVRIPPYEDELGVDLNPKP